MDLFRLDQPQTPFGLLGSSESYAVDIVAVHGLTGHYERTWIDQPSGRLWLRDFLPFDIPGARIYSFSYDARIFTDTVMTIGDYGLKLLGSLCCERLADEVRRNLDASSQLILGCCCADQSRGTSGPKSTDILHLSQLRWPSREEGILPNEVIPNIAKQILTISARPSYLQVKTQHIAI